jgi:hypothetical protein
LILKLKAGWNIFITGHSLGGAVAQLLTCELLKELRPHLDARELSLKLKCVSFAAPMVLMGKSADDVNYSHRDKFINFVDTDDVVPKVLAWGQTALVKD